MYEPVEDLKYRSNAIAHGVLAVINVLLSGHKGTPQELPLKNAREALMRMFYPKVPDDGRQYADQLTRLDCMVRINDEHSQLRELHPHGACIHIERIQVHEFMAFLYPTDKKIKSIPVSDSFMKRYKPEAPGYYLLTETGQNSWSKTVL